MVVLLLAAVLIVIINKEFGRMISSYDEYSYILSQIGRESINTLSLIELGLLFLIIPQLSSGAISSEFERKTFDVLAATSLSSKSIILQKFAAIAIQSISYIMLSVPILALAFLFGGVSPLEIFILLVLLLSSAIFISAGGVYCSSFFSKTSVASMVLFIGLVIIYGLTVLLGYGTQQEGMIGFVTFVLTAGLMSIAVYAIVTLFFRRKRIFWSVRWHRMVVYGFALFMVVISFSKLFVDVFFDQTTYSLPVSLFINPFAAIDIWMSGPTVFGYTETLTIVISTISFSIISAIAMIIFSINRLEALRIGEAGYK